MTEKTDTVSRFIDLDQRLRPPAVAPCRTAEQIRAIARAAKCFMYEARDTDDPLPTDPVIMRAAVAFNMLVRQGAIVATLDDLDLAHAIATIAANFADDPASTPQRAALFATDLGSEP